MMYLMSSKLYKSKKKIEGLVIAVANILFAWDWKSFQGLIDLNILTSKNNILRTEPLLETMSLNAIVEDMTDRR